jgi:predicted RNA polymerase sigma factor
MASGPAAALELVDAIAATGTLDRYHLLHAVRGDLLAKLSRHEDAVAAFERAASLAGNDAERALSEDRARASAALA